jgi:hypothetical protein
MRRIFQDRLGNQQGNCVWACIASLFPQFELDDLRYPPPIPDEVEAWTEKHLPDVQFRHRDLAINHEFNEETEKWSYDPPETWEPPCEGLWMGSIHSRGLMSPPESAYYGMPALHAVVMQDWELWHDPNPNYQNTIHLPFVLIEQTWWEPK